MVIQDFKKNCRACYACVRACPVKALKIIAGRTEILEEKCIFCGKCVVVCTRDGKIVESHIEKTRELLKKGKTVAILAPEWVASFYPVHPLKVKSGLLKLGFSEVQENTFGEELIAEKYRELFRLEETVIRSTCLPVVEWVEKFYPELIPYLAPIVSPPVAQARAIKAKDREVKVVFIGPCIAMKNEVEKRELDAVLTFKELKEMFKVEEIDLAKIRILETKGEARKRTSLFGGMPREELGRRNLLDTDIRVVRSVDEIDVLMEAIQKGEIKLKFIDALICNGCVAGSGMDTRLGLFARKRVIERYFATNQIGKAEKELPPFLAIDLSRTFTNKKTVFKMPTEEELGEVFLLGKKKLPEDFFNCGACGYSSCEETAIAIFQKFADWQICYPYQKKIILDLVKKLKQTTITESLTGLLNSAGFRRAVEHEIRRSERYGSTFSLIIFDVDYFKLINDTYGHVKGDHLLSLIAQLLRKNLREVDISARLGGDEFGIILPEVAKTEGFAVTEKLREAIKNFTFKPNGKERVHITISCGVAAYPSSLKRLKAEELIQLADEAMYKSKRDGRNKSHLA